MPLKKDFAASGKKKGKSAPKKAPPKKSVATKFNASGKPKANAAKKPKSGVSGKAKKSSTPKKPRRSIPYEPITPQVEVPKRQSSGKPEAGQLSEAIKFGNVDDVRELLKRRANVNERDDEGNTPLIWAAYYNEEEIAGILLEAGASLNAQNAEGFTAIMMAVDRDSIDMVRFLISKQADISIKNANGQTAHDLAREYIVQDEDSDSDSDYGDIARVLEKESKRVVAEKEQEKTKALHEVSSQKQQRLKDIAKNNKPKI